jgi:hypothetical protein
MKDIGCEGLATTFTQNRNTYKLQKTKTMKKTLLTAILVFISFISFSQEPTLSLKEYRPTLMYYIDSSLCIVIKGEKYKVTELKQMLDWYRNQKKSTPKVETVNEYLIYYNDTPYIKLSTHYDLIQNLINTPPKRRKK